MPIGQRKKEFGIGDRVWAVKDARGPDMGTVIRRVKHPFDPGYQVVVRFDDEKELVFDECEVGAMDEWGKEA